MADYDSLRQQVEADAGDFTAWSKLLAAVEEGATAYPERVAPTFESFLAKFPLCFGYWCKYADLQRRLGEAGSVDAAEAQEKAATIYDRALEAVPLSVELWKAYTAHVKAATAGQSSEKLRAAYKKATGRVGHDAAAAGLWDAFMEFEADRGTPETVCDVFKSMLGVDASGRTDELWRRFKHLSKSYQTPELVSEEDRKALEARWKAQKKEGDANAELDALANSRVAGMKELELQRQMEQLLLECEQAKNDLVQNRLERQHYEAGVRRWYFHVKPLDEAQLRNWREYLTREETAAYTDKEAHIKKVRALFERCLVPCALYAEFWLRYAAWCHSNIDATAALAVATRAATVFLPRRPDVLAALAALLESAGRLDDARAAYEAVAAGAVEADHKAYGAVLVANFERRVGGDVVGAYEKALANGAAPAPDARAPRALPLRRPQRRRGGAGRSRSSSGSGAGARRALAGARARRGAPRRGRQGDGRLRARRRGLRPGPGSGVDGACTRARPALAAVQGRRGRLVWRRREAARDLARLREVALARRRRGPAASPRSVARRARRRHRVAAAGAHTHTAKR